MKEHLALVFYAAVLALVVACAGGGATPTKSAIPTPEATPAPVETPTQQAAARPDNLGTLEIQVTDQPADAVSSILVTVENIEVHVSGGEEKSGWRTVVEGPRQFDLKELIGVEEVLGSASLEPGKYQQVRFEVVEAVITVRGMPRESPVPSGKIRIVGGFEISAGATTIVTLDIDAEKSVVFRPGQGPQLRPVVKMLVRKGGLPLSEAKVVASMDADAEGSPAATPTPALVARPGGATPIRVVIPTNDNLQVMSFWTALGAGFFNDEGLDVQTVFPPFPDRAGQFMLEGMADVAILPPPMYLPLIAEQEPILLFANLIENDQINLIVRQDFATENNLSTDLPLTDLPLKERLEAIRGMKVGVAPGPPTRLRVLFDSVGLDADSDIEMVIVHGAEQNQAFEDGSVDALYAHTPYQGRALVRQDAVVLVNQSAGEVPALIDRQSHSLVATRSFVTANREDLVALTRAVRRAQMLIRTDQAAAVEALLESGVPDLDKTLLETIVGIYAPAIPESPEVSIEGIERALDLFPAHRTPPDLTGIDIGDYVALGISQGISR